MKGTLYGISVGPGDPELLTLKAVRAIQRCPVVAAPRTTGGGTVALDIVRGAMPLEGKELLMLDFAMSHDPEERAERHRAAAAILEKRLRQGLDVALLNLGDVSLYASYHYIAEQLRKDYAAEMVPGVPSFCAAAALLGRSLTVMDEPLHLMPGGSAGEEFPNGSRVYMKSGRQLRSLLQELERRDELNTAVLVQNCSLPGQRVYYGAKALEADDSYFSLVICTE